MNGQNGTDFQTDKRKREESTERERDGLARVSGTLVVYLNDYLGPLYGQPGDGHDRSTTGDSTRYDTR